MFTFMMDIKKGCSTHPALVTNNDSNRIYFANNLFVNYCLFHVVTELFGIGYFIHSS